MAAPGAKPSGQPTGATGMPPKPPAPGPQSHLPPLSAFTVATPKRRMRFVDYVVLLSFGMFLGSSTLPFVRALLESDDGSLLDGYRR